MLNRSKIEVKILLALMSAIHTSNKAEAVDESSNPLNLEQLNQKEDNSAQSTNHNTAENETIKSQVNLKTESEYPNFQANLSNLGGDISQSGIQSFVDSQNLDADKDVSQSDKCTDLSNLGADKNVDQLDSKPIIDLPSLGAPLKKNNTSSIQMLLKYMFRYMFRGKYYNILSGMLMFLCLALIFIPLILYFGFSKPMKTESCPLNSVLRYDLLSYDLTNRTSSWSEYFTKSNFDLLKMQFDDSVITNLACDGNYERLNTTVNTSMIDFIGSILFKQDFILMLLSKVNLSNWFFSWIYSKDCTKDEFLMILKKPAALYKKYTANEIARSVLSFNNDLDNFGRQIFDTSTLLMRLIWSLLLFINNPINIKIDCVFLFISLVILSESIRSIVSKKFTQVSKIKENYIDPFKLIENILSSIQLVHSEYMEEKEAERLSQALHLKRPASLGEEIDFKFLTSNVLHLYSGMLCLIFTSFYPRLVLFFSSNSREKKEQFEKTILTGFFETAPRLRTWFIFLSSCVDLCIMFEKLHMSKEVICTSIAIREAEEIKDIPRVPLVRKSGQIELKIKGFIHPEANI